MTKNMLAFVSSWQQARMEHVKKHFYTCVYVNNALCDMPQPGQLHAINTYVRSSWLWHAIHLVGYLASWETKILQQLIFHPAILHTYVYIYIYRTIVDRELFDGLPTKYETIWKSWGNAHNLWNVLMLPNTSCQLRSASVSTRRTPDSKLVLDHSVPWLKQCGLQNC